jgi:hypothetical protein
MKKIKKIEKLDITKDSLYFAYGAINSLISHVESLEKAQEEERRRITKIEQDMYVESLRTPVHEEFCRCEEPLMDYTTGECSDCHKELRKPVNYGDFEIHPDGAVTTATKTSKCGLTGEDGNKQLREKILEIAYAVYEYGYEHGSEGPENSREKLEPDEAVTKILSTIDEAIDDEKIICHLGKNLLESKVAKKDKFVKNGDICIINTRLSVNELVDFCLSDIHQLLK